MRERWKKIPGYEGLYLASNKGQIKSLVVWNGSKTRILQPATKKDKHLHLVLYKNKQGKTWLVHQLIMLTFIGPPPHGMECLHIDGDHNNNWLTNLKYGTHKDNMRDCSRHKRFPTREGAHNARAKLTPEQVLTIRRLYDNNTLLPNKEKLSQLAIANMFGMSEYAIWAVVNRKTWTHI